MSDDLFSRFQGPGRFTKQHAVPQERPYGADIQPAPFVDRARNAAETVIIDDDGIQVTSGSIDVANGTVVLDSSGLAITDGAITVENQDGTVIIDGTSNMFKIAATGTMSRSVAIGAMGVSTTVTLSALGALATTPAHVSFLATGNTSTANQHLGVIPYGGNPPTQKWAAGASGGATNQAIIGLQGLGEMHTNLDGSSQATIVLTGFGQVAAFTLYGRYYVLQEAAL